MEKGGGRDWGKTIMNAIGDFMGGFASKDPSYGARRVKLQQDLEDAKEEHKYRKMVRDVFMKESQLKFKKMMDEIQWGSRPTSDIIKPEMKDVETTDIETGKNYPVAQPTGRQKVELPPNLSVGEAGYLAPFAEKVKQIFLPPPVQKEIIHGGPGTQFIKVDPSTGEASVIHTVPSTEKPETQLFSTKKGIQRISKVGEEGLVPGTEPEQTYFNTEQEAVKSVKPVAGYNVVGELQPGGGWKPHYLPQHKVAGEGLPGETKPAKLKMVRDSLNRYYASYYQKRAGTSLEKGDVENIYSKLNVNEQQAYNQILALAEKNAVTMDVEGSVAKALKDWHATYGQAYKGKGNLPKRPLSDFEVVR
jgi:hypothetical protein